MSQSYLSILGESHVEQIEKKSQFIGDLTHLESKEEAEQYIKKLRLQYKDARHWVYAYRLFSGVEHCSDDGEPQGTAGLPILEVLRRENLYGVCLVVTRYFGGVLLGTGGLFRAYSSCAKETVKQAEKVPFSLCRQLFVTLAYSRYDAVSRFFQKKGCEVLHPQFEDRVTFEVFLPLAIVESCKKTVTEMTAGECGFQEGKQVYSKVQIE